MLLVQNRVEPETWGGKYGQVPSLLDGRTFAVDRDQPCREDADGFRRGGPGRDDQAQRRGGDQDTLRRVEQHGIPETGVPQGVGRPDQGAGRAPVRVRHDDVHLRAIRLPVESARHPGNGRAEWLQLRHPGLSLRLRGRLAGDRRLPGRHPGGIPPKGGIRRRGDSGFRRSDRADPLQGSRDGRHWRRSEEPGHRRTVQAREAQRPHGRSPELRFGGSGGVPPGGVQGQGQHAGLGAARGLLPVQPVAHQRERRDRVGAREVRHLPRLLRSDGKQGHPRDTARQLRRGGRGRSRTPAWVSRRR